MRDTTLCYIFNNGKILLQKKTKGKFGGGKWNGPGGKIEKKETPEQAAIREVKEETCLDVSGLKRTGMINFSEDGGESFFVHVFVTDNFTGKIKTSEEGELKWFTVKSIPYEEMWEDDTHWFPYMLKKENFIGSFHFTKGFKKLIKHNVKTMKHNKAVEKT